MNNPNIPNPPQNPNSPEDTVICSGKGCRAAAVWVLAWNNPKLHTPERRKTWLSCDDHLDHLTNFLDLRGFLKQVVTLQEWESRDHGGSSAGPAAAPSA